ncbi:Ig-like domain-containing protein, partial [Acinetobacter sp.]|uniref:Ig-like domain-containing protein n=1 Tax=Acinetobacter sp. TaxID=472 RepID=UPI003C73FD78
MNNQTITVKIHSAKKIISTLNVTKTPDQPMIIQAKKNVNYELIDDATQFAPENIKIKRVGNDLHIGFEDGSSDPLDADLIIQDYYGHDGVTSNLLIGLHENGSYYAYVPESGLQEHAVSMLAEEVSAGQALGGEPLVAAAYEFNPYWLLALIPLVGLAVAASNDDDNSVGDITAPVVTVNDSNSNDSTPALGGTVNDPTAIVVVEVDGVKYPATNNGDGTWSLADNVLPPLGDGSYPVKVTATDPAGNSSTDTGLLTVDTVAPAATLSIDAVTSDSIINAAEAGLSINISGSVTGEYQLGDVVSLNINGKLYNTTVQSGGLWNADVAGSDLAADSDSKINGSVLVHDLVGNSFTAIATESYAVDTTAPTLTISAADLKLAAGESTTITFSFNEPVSGFSQGDVI